MISNSWRLARLVVPLAALLAAGLTNQSSIAGVDLTPRFTDIFTEGVVQRRIYFSDGGKKFVLSLNRETEVLPDSGGALFRFSKFPDITFLMVRSRLSPDVKFEGSGLERYRESARALLPLQAASGQINEEAFDPLPVNGWKSYRINLSFFIGKVRYLQSVTFLNLNDTDQIVLLTASPEKDFEEASVRSFHIIRTWQEMLPSDEHATRKS